jgi:hypothetical protein
MNEAVAAQDRWIGEHHMRGVEHASLHSLEKGDIVSKLANTGERRYLVLDFDAGDADHHAAIIWFLAQKRPLKLVMHSANKSLHGWFKVAGLPDEALLAFMEEEEAVGLGADPGLWWKEHFARIAGGWRDDDKAKGRQSVLYVNDSL